MKYLAGLDVDLFLRFCHVLRMNPFRVLCVQSLGKDGTGSFQISPLAWTWEFFETNPLGWTIKYGCSVVAMKTRASLGVPHCNVQHTGSTSLACRVGDIGLRVSCNDAFLSMY